MNKVLVISLVALICCAGGCSRDDASAMTDADLEREIAAKINSDTQLNIANLSVRADAALNAATISGTVESEAVRSKAVELARDVRPNLVVVNKIDVRLRELSREEFTQEHALNERARAKQRKERLGTSVDDAWIHSRLVTQLISDSNTAEQNISVDVDRGVVTLRGLVDSAMQKAAAERISKEAAGVKRVNNVIKVSKPF